MRAMSRYLMLFALLLATGCQSLGLEPAASFDAKWAYAYGTYTAVTQAANQALSTGSISVDDAKYILKAGDDARGLLDAAKVVADSGDAAAANNKLLLATAVLTQLQTYLNSHKGKH